MSALTDAWQNAQKRLDDLEGDQSEIARLQRIAIWTRKLILLTPSKRWRGGTVRLKRRMNFAGSLTPALAMSLPLFRHKKSPSASGMT
jgi:hypothetical protein